jgi:hypothetical protein
MKCLLSLLYGIIYFFDYKEALLVNTSIIAADEEGSESDDISASSDSDEEDSKHHLLNSQNADVSFIKEKPIALQ